MATDPQLVATVRRALASGAGYSELHAILVEFRDAGGLQATAYHSLEEVRASVEEAAEDAVLEVLDAVVGWCSPHQKIWATGLEE